MLRSHEIKLHLAIIHDQKKMPYKNAIVHENYSYALKNCHLTRMHILGISLARPLSLKDL